MGDFYSVLRQSIIDRGLRSAKAREEAYAHARRAMINRLWAYNPPLAEDEIDHRIGQFDTAVARIEDDVIEVFAGMADAAGRDHGEHRTRHSGTVHGEDDDAHEDYPAAFGGTPGPEIQAGETASEPDDADRGDDDGDDGPPPRSLDETSRAVERALLDAQEDAGPVSLATAHDEDLAGWSVATADDDAAAASNGDDRPEAEPPPRAKRAWPALADLRQRAAGVLAAPDVSHVRVLVGVVVALSVVLVGGIVWLLLPRSAPPADPTVVLVTDVPGGISDPETAIRLPKEAIAVTTSFSIFDGRDPTVFESDPDNPVRFDGELARISTSVASAGGKVIVGAGLSSRLAGRTIRVTLDARSARENGATSMRFAYESGVAISHWQTANLSSEFTELGLVWRVPTMRTNPAGDYIVIEPGIPGSGTAVEIRSVRIDLVDE